MNCRDIPPLLSAERDGTLTAEQRTLLDRHVASCPACEELRARLSLAMDVFKNEVAAVRVPDVGEEWLKLRAKLSVPSAKRLVRRPVAPLVWFGLPLAAAAAVAFAFFNHSPPSAKSVGDSIAIPGEVAQAEYVEAGNADASTIVYVDKDSGWLVVWATDNDSESKK